MDVAKLAVEDHQGRGQVREQVREIDIGIHDASPRTLATPFVAGSLAGYVTHFNEKGVRTAPDALFGFGAKRVQAL